MSKNILFLYLGLALSSHVFAGSSDDWDKMNLKYPVHHGIITNWDDPEKIWHHSFPSDGPKVVEHEDIDESSMSFENRLITRDICNYINWASCPKVKQSDLHYFKKLAEKAYKNINVGIGAVSLAMIAEKYVDLLVSGRKTKELEDFFKKCVSKILYLMEEDGVKLRFEIDTKQDKKLIKAQKTVTKLIESLGNNV